jgi:hypothetical protein
LENGAKALSTMGSKMTAFLEATEAYLEISDPTFNQFQMVYELEHRHELAGQLGKLGVLGFLSRGRMGRLMTRSCLRTRTE